MRVGRFLILTICAFAVFGPTMTFAHLLPAWGNWAARGGLIVLSFGLWLAARGDGPLNAYRPVFLAWLAAVVGLSLGYYLSDPLLARLHLTTDTATGVAVAKALQASLIVIGVIVTAMLFGETAGSLYIRKGRLLLGVCIGLAGCAIFVGLTFAPSGPFFQSATTAGGAAKLLPLVPWVLLFVLSNAFMEELLFRGLLIGRYETLVGKWPALLATAIPFALAHMQVNYTSQVAGFVAFVFVLGLMWGWLMQTSRSIWGSVLFHAGADVAVILPIFQHLPR
jgi:membrane protease YdiL (CAAX protease family)